VVSFFFGLSEMYVAPLAFTRKADWFHGALSRQETERRLRDASAKHSEATLFMVRRSSTRPGFYALSMLCLQRLYNFVICKRVRPTAPHCSLRWALLGLYSIFNGFIQKKLAHQLQQERSG